MDETPGIATSLWRLISFLVIPLALSAVMWAIIIFVIRLFTDSWLVTGLCCAAIVVISLGIILYFIWDEGREVQPKYQTQRAA